MQLISSGAYVDPDDNKKLVFRGEGMRDRDRKLLEELLPDVRNDALLAFAICEVMLQSSRYYLSLFGRTPCFRTAQQQHKLYEKGRRRGTSGRWIIDNKKKIVTYCDGVRKKSKHQLKIAMDPGLRYRYTNAPIWADDRMPVEARRCWELVKMEFDKKFTCGIFTRNFVDANHFEYKEK